MTLFPLATAQALVLTALPHGGQRSARRNAWASMASDATRARGRREADAAMGEALALAAPSVASAHGAAGG
ncbi:MAG: hypothetical protein JWN87_775 [Frankiales bacterium]|nr:hypothetical protein [Frankiales bacterium]